MFDKSLDLATQSVAYVNSLVTEVGKIAAAVTSIDRSLARIADHFDPSPADIVGSRLHREAARLHQSLGRGDGAPRARFRNRCVVQGTGNGKPWKFHRQKIEEWINNR